MGSAFNGVKHFSAAGGWGMAILRLSTRLNRGNGSLRHRDRNPRHAEWQGRTAMKTVKTLILAARTLLSLGIGTPMAQSERASTPTDLYAAVNVPSQSRQATT